MPRDIATRAIHRIVYQEKLGIDGQPAVYLDVTHIPRETLDRKLEGILEIYEKFLRRGPSRRADESFSRDALHHGRDLGEWRRSGDERSGDLCGGRMRVSISRREPAGREFAGVLHFWRGTGGASGGEVRARIWTERRGVHAVGSF